MAERLSKSLPLAGSADALVAAAASPRETTVSVPDLGVSVRVRGLTRGEARRFGDMTAEECEVYALTTAVVEPAFTEEQARALLTDGAFGVGELILDRILEASGLRPGFRPE